MAGRRQGEGRYAEMIVLFPPLPTHVQPIHERGLREERVGVSGRRRFERLYMLLPVTLALSPFMGRGNPRRIRGTRR